MPVVCACDICAAAPCTDQPHADASDSESTPSAPHTVTIVNLFDFINRQQLISPISSSQSSSHHNGGQNQVRVREIFRSDTLQRAIVLTHTITSSHTCITNIVRTAGQRTVIHSLMSDAAALKKENDALKQEIAQLQSQLNADPLASGNVLISTAASPTEWALDGKDETALTSCVLSIVVIGASGDLAVKKTFPALFSLFVHELLPKNLIIAGYARSPMDDAAFKKKISEKFSKKDENRKQEFLNKCFYHAGQYDSAADFALLTKTLDEKETSLGGKNAQHYNRIFYFAIPPTVFIPTARSLHASSMTKRGWNRVIVEKPFGHDSASSAELGRDLGALFSEEEIYRIDHYLGKEMVQNLMVLRFSNKVFEPIWNRHHVGSVQITFKEDFGTLGRGGYFDSFGIIRDVMQNHLLQMLSLVGMETPVSLSAEDVRNEKVKLLRAIRPIVRSDIVIGQYGADPKGREGSYLEDKTVPNGSITPTFACAVLWIDNDRWSGTPFILKCGKALSERKADIRIQFQTPTNGLFSDVSPNELVLRVQPDEAVYLKLTTKQPGLEGGSRHTELDLSYKKRFDEAKALPDAYERLIFDVVRGDHNLFVRADELVAAWKIFTPILHQLDREKIKPEIYEYGGRGPASADELIARVGYKRTDKYTWSPNAETAAAGTSKL